MPTIPYVNRAGKRLAGVTTILNNLGWSSGALMYWAWNEGMEGRNFRDTAGAEAQAGTLAHHYCECNLTGQKRNIDQFPMPADVEKKNEVLKKADRGYDQFLKWKQTYGLKPLHLPSEVIDGLKAYLNPKVSDRINSEFGIELNLISEKYQYGFTIDVVGFIQGTLSIIDLKTATGTYPDHVVQGAAYMMGWNEVMKAIGQEAFVIENDFHLLRLGKNDASFHHHHWDDLEDEWGAFLEARSLHERHKRIKKRV